MQTCGEPVVNKKKKEDNKGNEWEQAHVSNTLLGSKRATGREGEILNK